MASTGQRGAGVIGARRWRGPALIALTAYVGALVVTVALGNRPDPVRLALVVLVLVAAGSVLLGAARVERPDWGLGTPPNLQLARVDPRTAMLLNVLESHLTAAQPDGAVRDRLRELADRALRTRHELSLHDPRAAPLLGPELAEVLTSGPRRLRRQQIERLVRRIEEL